MEAIRSAQTAALAVAVASASHGNLAALEAFVVAEQAKRNETASKTYLTYALWRGASVKHYEAVLSPDMRVYLDEMTIEGTRRFPDCPDQIFVDEVNAHARHFGVLKRLETKHSMIAFLLERALHAETLVWAEAEKLGGLGYMTVPNPHRHPHLIAGEAFVSDSESEADFRQEMDAELDAELAAARDVEKAEAMYVEADRTFRTARQSFWDANEAVASYHRRLRAGTALPGEKDAAQSLYDAVTAAHRAWDEAAAYRSSAAAEMSAAWATLAQCTGDNGIPADRAQKIGVDHGK